ncbi:MAG: cyclic peptide export ABC transporter [Kiloniellaceae bacterium]
MLQIDKLVPRARMLFAAAFITSLVCGAANALLVMLINASLHRLDGGLAQWLLPFAGIAVLAMLSQMASRALFAHLGQQCLAALRRYVAQVVIDAPFRRLEMVGRARIQSLLTDDAMAIATFLVAFPITATNAVIVVGCLAYLAYLSWVMFLAAAAAVLIGSIAYHLCHQKVLDYLRLAGKGQDHLFNQFESLVGGAKELKLNRGKARLFQETVLAQAIDVVARNRTKGLLLLAVTLGWGRFLFLALIGMVLFSPLWVTPESSAVITGYVIVFLFVMAPLEGILVTLPDFNLARVALGRIRETTQRLSGEGEGQPLALGDGSREIELRLEGVTHSYYSERDDESFVLGPIDLTLRPGEATFLVGGNGCGKTTLAKLITGLYQPEAGALRVNGAVVTEEARESYRQLFSAVFSDFHLFESLLHAADSESDALANDWLRKLHLDHKVKVTDGAFSTRDLSQGQRKRLALIAACVEDRPVMVFDEWAADQDPVFKKAFYHQILGELKARGKTLLVISHDDRYFALADQMVKMERGQIVEQTVAIDDFAAAVRSAE